MRIVEVKSIFAESFGFESRDESNIDELFGSLEVTETCGKGLETKKFNRIVSCKTKNNFRGKPWC